MKRPQIYAFIDNFKMAIINKFVLAMDHIHVCELSPCSRSYKSSLFFWFNALQLSHKVDFSRSRQRFSTRSVGYLPGTANRRS